MKRKAQPTAEQLERARQSAREARVKAGLPAAPPGDELYEQLQAERRARSKRPKKGAS